MKVRPAAAGDSRPAGLARTSRRPQMVTALAWEGLRDMGMGGWLESGKKIGEGLTRQPGLAPSPRGLPRNVLHNFVKFFELFLVAQGLAFPGEPVFLFAATRLCRNCPCNQFLSDRRFQVGRSEMLVIFQIENILEFSS